MVDLWIVYSIRLISWVVPLIMLGNIFYVQIRAVNNETPILFNIVKSMHDTVTKIVSIHVFNVND